MPASCASCARCSRPGTSTCGRSRRVHRRPGRRRPALSFVENAILKARFAARRIRAAGDRRRFRPRGRCAARRARRAFGALRGRRGDRRRQQRATARRARTRVPDAARGPRATAARWSTCAGRDDPAPIVVQAQLGRSHRAQPRSGHSGFGYDPLFVVAGDGTLPPRSSTRRRRIVLSHRGQALARAGARAAAAPGTAIDMRHRAARAVRAPALVRAQVPVLRLQFARRCPTAGVPEDAYLDALLEDLEHAAARGAERPPTSSSVFFGGGTPSLFSPAAIERVLAARQRAACCTFAPALEVTLEANPGTIEHGAFAGLSRGGRQPRVARRTELRRPERLAALGRIHAAAETRSAVAELRAAGIDNFNLDLMYALPGQDLADAALADIERGGGARACASVALPAHARAGHGVRATPTAAARRRSAVCDMQEACQARLAAAGYGQYEVSAYARADAALRAQPQLLALRRLPRHRRRRAWQAHARGRRGDRAHGRGIAASGALSRGPDAG